MAYSYVLYTGTGAQTDWTFSFPYLSSSHISVKVDGVTTAYTFVNSSTVRISPAPASGKVIEIARETPKSAVPVDFTDGSTLTEATLDYQALWSLYVAQENDDAAKRGLLLNSSGIYDAGTFKISNLSDPASAQDAATKAWVEQRTGLTQAEATALITAANSATAAISTANYNAAAQQGFRLSTSLTNPLGTDSDFQNYVYAVPYIGNGIGLYNGTTWNIRTANWMALPTAALDFNKAYDIFCFDNNGTPSLEFTAWTDSTTRATALAYQDGVLVRSGSPTRRYLGSVFTGGGQTVSDSKTRRFVWNYYHRVRKPLYVAETTTSWTYTTNTWRLLNGSLSTQLQVFTGLAEEITNLTVKASVSNTGGAAVAVGIALGGSQTTNSATTFGGFAATVHSNVQAHYSGVLPIGNNVISPLEISQATGTTTWYGSSTPHGVPAQTVFYGEVWC